MPYKVFAHHEFLPARVFESFLDGIAIIRQGVWRVKGKLYVPGLLT